MTAKLNTKQFIELASNLHKSYYSYDKVVYSGSKTKVIITCSKHGDFWQTPNEHLQKRGCRPCGYENNTKNRTHTLEQFLKTAKEKFHDRFTYDYVNYVDTKTKVIITCVVHGNFEQTPHAFLQQKYGCSPCSDIMVGNINRNSLENFIEEANKIHDFKYSYNKSKYTDCITKVIITCLEHGDFNQTPSAHTSQKQGCPICGMLSGISKRTHTLEQFIESANIIHNNFYSYDKVNYINNQTQIIITCPIHGDFSQTPGSHINGKHNCPICGIKNSAQKRTLSTEQFIELANEIHKNKYTYEKTIYTKSHDRVIITCPIHGDLNKLAYCHLQGKGCQKCLFDRLAEESRFTLEEFIDLANKKHEYKYSYNDSVYVNCLTKLFIRCHKHGNFPQAPSCHLSGQGCPKCTHRVSKGEKAWLDSLNISQDYRQYSVFIDNNKWFLVDAYDPITNTVYEFNGSYWHGDPRVFDSNIIHPKDRKNRTYGELYDATLVKMEQLISAEYNIISMWEYDWKLQLKQQKIDLIKT